IDLERLVGGGPEFRFVEDRGDQVAGIRAGGRDSGTREKHGELIEQSAEKHGSDGRRRTADGSWDCRRQTADRTTCAAVRPLSSELQSAVRRLPSHPLPPDNCSLTVASLNASISSP